MENEQDSQNCKNVDKGGLNNVPEIQNKKVFPVGLTILTVVYAIFLAMTAGSGWVLILLIWFGTPLVFGILFRVSAYKYAKQVTSGLGKKYTKAIKLVLFCQIVAIILALLVAFVMSDNGKVQICLDWCQDSGVLGLLPYMIVYSIMCSVVSMIALAIGWLIEREKQKKAEKIN